MVAASVIAMSTTRDNPLHIDRTGKSAEEIERAYRDFGVVALRDFFSPSRVAILSEQCDLLLAKLKAGEIDSARIAYRPTTAGVKIFERFDPVCDIAPAFEDLTRDPALLALVRDLIGGEPFLFMDKVIYKFEDDRGYGLHQDYPYYKLTDEQKDSVVTIAIAIDSVSSEAGGIRFYLKCHDRVQPAPENDPKDVDPEAVASAEVWDAELTPGSLVAFHTLTPHGSGPNKAGRPRRMLYFTYMPGNARDLRHAYYQARIQDQRLKS